IRKCAPADRGEAGSGAASHRRHPAYLKQDVRVPGEARLHHSCPRYHCRRDGGRQFRNHLRPGAGRRGGDDRRRQIAGGQQGARGDCRGRGGRQTAGRTLGRREAQVSPSRTFILRPVATSLLMVGILLAGAVAYRQLPVSALPEVDYPTIQVITFYPGASPDVMASSVTAPLERQFGQVPGLQQMTSTSSDGGSVITLQFKLSLNIEA